MSILYVDIIKRNFISCSSIKIDKKWWTVCLWKYNIFTVFFWCRPNFFNGASSCLRVCPSYLAVTLLSIVGFKFCVTQMIVITRENLFPGHNFVVYGGFKFCLCQHFSGRIHWIYTKRTSSEHCCFIFINHAAHSWMVYVNIQECQSCTWNNYQAFPWSLYPLKLYWSWSLNNKKDSAILSINNNFPICFSSQFVVSNILLYLVSIKEEFNWQ